MPTSVRNSVIETVTSSLWFIHTYRVQLRNHPCTFIARAEIDQCEYIHAISDKLFLFSVSKSDSVVMSVSVDTPLQFVLPREVVEETSWLRTDPRPNQICRRMDLCRWRTPSPLLPLRPSISTNYDSVV